jgi:hypothetical protein
LDEREDDLRAGTIVYALRKGEQFVCNRPDELKQRTFADHLKPAVLISLNTGLRQGELLKLKWENVNFQQALITVIGSTSKTGKTRHIPLNGEALFVLRAWKSQRGNKSFSGYVFPSIDGAPMREIGKSWEGLLKRVGIASFRWHDLRHTFASKLVMAGENLNTVRELLGHADYKMTLRYAHLAPEHKAAAVAKLCSRNVMGGLAWSFWACLDLGFRCMNCWKVENNSEGDSFPSCREFETLRPLKFQKLHIAWYHRSTTSSRNFPEYRETRWDSSCLLINDSLSVKGMKRKRFVAAIWSKLCSKYIVARILSSPIGCLS